VGRRWLRKLSLRRRFSRSRRLRRRDRAFWQRRVGHHGGLGAGRCGGLHARRHVPEQVAVGSHGNVGASLIGSILSTRSRQ